MEKQYTVSSTNAFLSFYNKIDKFFSYVLGLDKYLSYHEKINMIIEGKTKITAFVRLYQQKLRYFGELRNQLVHGFRIDHNHYLLVSDHAVQEIKSLYHEMRSPRNIVEVWGKKVYTCMLHDLLMNVICSMRKNNNIYVPVYNQDNIFVGVLSDKIISYWFADTVLKQKNICYKNVVVGDLVDFNESSDEFVFLDKDTSIYEIEDLFTKYGNRQKKLGAVFITDHGCSSENIISIITAGDIPLLYDYFVL